MPSVRDTIFISHANPEDNSIAEWFALQLTLRGYTVWSDVTKLLGGDNLWPTADDVLRNRSIKFVFLLSEQSNKKRGTLMELDLANDLDRSIPAFIVPLKIDSMEYSEANIILHGKLIIDSRNLREGLNGLIDRLEKDKVPKSEQGSPTLVCDWWAANHNAVPDPNKREDTYSTNWFEILESPKCLYASVIESGHDVANILLRHLDFPATMVGDYIVSFASDELSALLDNSNIGLSGQHMICLDASRQSGTTVDWFDSAKFSLIYSRLMNSAWNRMAKARGLRGRQMANKKPCFYFPYLLAPKNKVEISFDGFKTSKRQVCGANRTSVDAHRARPRRYWHLGLSAKFSYNPAPMYQVNTHVLFSDNGHEIWQDNGRLHTARRRFCRSWWNDRWFGLLLAGASWLAGQQATIKLPTGSTEQILVRARPIGAVGIQSYEEPMHGLPNASDELEDYSIEEEI